MISSTVIHCFSFVVVRNIFTIWCAFPSICKDGLPSHQESLVIYRSKCQSGADYVSKTIQHSKVRIAHRVPGSIRRHTLITPGNIYWILSLVRPINQQNSSMWCTGLGRNTVLTSLRRLLSTRLVRLCVGRENWNMNWHFSTCLCFVLGEL